GSPARSPRGRGGAGQAPRHFDDRASSEPWISTPLHGSRAPGRSRLRLRLLEEGACRLTVPLWPLDIFGRKIRHLPVLHRHISIIITFSATCTIHPQLTHMWW